MAYELDGAAKQGREEAHILRRRKIDWPEQEEFLSRHKEDYGDLWELGLERARLAFEKYGDNTFWFPRDLLQLMFEEEIGDAIFYHIVLSYRRELIGDYCEELGDVPEVEDEWSEEW